MKKIIVLMGVMSLLFAFSVNAETKKIVIKISDGLSNQHPTHLGCIEFKRIVEQKLGDKYEVQVYSDAQLGDDVRATEAVRMGTLEMVATSASPLTGLVQEFNVFDLPFIITTTKAADAIFDGPVGAKLAKLLESKGFILLAYYENGFRDVTNSVHAIKSPADLKGLKIRTMQNPIHLAAWRALGANPTPMPFSEVFTAMQQNVIDGQENPIPTIYLSRYYEVQKYVTLTNHVYGPHILLINKKLFESFPPNDQKIMREAALASAKYQRSLNRKLATDDIAELKKSGMIVTELSPKELAEFKKATLPVYTEWEPKIGKALVEEFQAAARSAK